MKVINMRGRRFQVPDGAVYVGGRDPWGRIEGSKFANPFSVKRYGREDAIERYRDHLASRPDLVEAARRELAGKDLACWCAPDACHADVLIELTREGAR
jgi:hypothetical protein